jgi:glucose-1-phosphate adenylyltransferase
MNDADIGAGACVDRAVLDKGVVVGVGAVVGEGAVEAPNQESPNALQAGVCLVGKQAEIPAGARLGRNCIVYPEIRAGDWREPVLASGGSLHTSEGAGV